MAVSKNMPEAQVSGTMPRKRSLKNWFLSYVLVPLTLLTNSNLLSTARAGDTRDGKIAPTERRAQTAEDIFLEATQKDSKVANIERTAYQRFRDKLTGRTETRQFTAPLGSSFGEIRVNSSAGKWRNLNNLGPKKHDGIDVGLRGVKKQGGLPVKAIDDFIVTESRKIRVSLGKKHGKHVYAKKRTGIVKGVSLDGERHYTFMHVDVLPKDRLNTVIQAGETFTKLEKKGPFPSHFHMEIRDKNGRLQTEMMNSLVPNGGKISVTEENQTAKIIGPYVAEKLRGGETTEEIMDQILRENQIANSQKLNGTVSTSKEAIIDFVMIHIEGGLSKDHKTKYGVTKSSYPNLNIPNLGQHKARQLYDRDFWQAMSLDDYAGNPEFQFVAFQAGIQIGVNGINRYIKEADGDARKMLAIHKALLAERGTNGRRRRIEVVTQHLEKIEQANLQQIYYTHQNKSIPLQPVFAEKVEKVLIANSMIVAEQQLIQASMEQQETARMITAKQNMDSLIAQRTILPAQERAVYPIAEDSAQIQSAFYITPPIRPMDRMKVSSQEITAQTLSQEKPKEPASLSKNSKPEIPGQEPWKKRMHNLYSQNLGGITKKPEATGVTAPTRQYA